MAEENTQSRQHLATRGNETRLMYLGFVQVAAVHALMCFSALYAFAKEHSGPLKPGVESVEVTVKSVVRPVYDKFHDVPVQVLKYVDCKVGESLTKLDSHVPYSIKKASIRAKGWAEVADMATEDVVNEVKREGVVNTASRIANAVYYKCEPKAKELYAKYEPKAEQCAVSAWKKLNRLPLFPQVANVVLPPAAFCTEKYNQAVVHTAQKGYRFSAFLPLVPTEKISRIFVENKA